MSIEPLPGELSALIAGEPPPRVPPELEARLLARLDASVAVAVADAGGAPAHAAGSGVATQVGFGVAVFAAGVIVGAVLHAQLAQPTVVISPPTSPPTVVAVVEKQQVEREAEPPPTRPTPAPNVASPKKPKEVAVAVSTLEEERRLLEPARTALGRGMASQALELVEKHAAQFPRGELAEEREALWVQALSVSGDAASARDRAARFKAQWPESLFLPVVERSAGK